MDFGNCFCVIGSNIAQHRSTFSQLWRLMNWSPHILQDKSVRYAFCHFRPAFTSILTNTTLWYFCELGTLSILGWQFINNKTQHRTMWASKMKDSLTTWPVMITIDDGSWWIMMMHDDASFRSSGVPGFQGSRVPFQSSGSAVNRDWNPTAQEDPRGIWRWERDRPAPAPRSPHPSALPRSGALADLSSNTTKLRCPKDPKRPQKTPKASSVLATFAFQVF